MSEETKTVETKDDRYVKICARIKQIGESVQEQIFQAVENDDFDAVVELVDNIRSLDMVYMMAKRKGFEIIEANRTPEERAAIERAKAAASGCPITPESAPN